MIAKRLTYFRVFCLLLPSMVAMVLLCPVQTEAAPPEEHQIKAAMLFNMIRFIEWPESKQTANADRITICVYGKSALIDAVGPLAGKQVRGKSIAVRQVGKSLDFSACQLMVAVGHDHRTPPALLEQTRSLPLLTIGETKGFAESGGVIGFIIREDKVRFEINLSSAKQHRLRISSRLLKLAQTVYE